VPPRVPVFINGEPLAVLRGMVMAYYPTLRDVRPNPAVVRGAPLYERFVAAAAASAGARVLSGIMFLLHGTPEENIDSILTIGLRGRPELCKLLVHQQPVHRQQLCARRAAHHHLRGAAPHAVSTPASHGRVHFGRGRAPPAALRGAPRLSENCRVDA
jgi:hypothetical protein